MLELAPLPEVELQRIARVNVDGKARLADFFAGRDYGDVIAQVVREVSSGNFPAANSTFLEHLRQLGMRSLWFYLKYIAGFSGAYNDLDETLHLEMANVRQRAIRPGARFAALLPRGFFKSTIWSHGANGWELLRDPDLRIAVISNTAERAAEFMHLTQRTFDSNELFKALYPEYVPSGKDGSRWNDKEAVLPNRTRDFTDPSLRSLGALGSTQGVHVGLENIDDLVGEAQLDSDRSSTLEMHKIKNWFKSNQRTLLYPQRTGRIVLTATRYALDDPYEDLMTDCREQLGGAWSADEANVAEDYPRKEDGAWSIYYRLGIENGVIVNPMNLTQEIIDRTRADDPWTYNTQIINNPRQAMQVEFARYRVRTFSMDWSAQSGWKILLFDQRGEEKIYLSDCDVVVAGDPAASRKQHSSRTSKSSVVTVARDCHDRKFVLSVQRGFVAPEEFFGWLFAEVKKWGLAVRKTVVEGQGPFKILEGILRGEEQRRKEWLRLEVVPALGDKDVTIRNILQPELERNLLLVNERFERELLEELQLFPQSSRKDVLDAVKLAVHRSIRPLEPGERERHNDNMQDRRRGVNLVTGY